MITLKPFQLEVLSALFTDLAAVWLITVFGARDFLVLTGNLFSFIISLVLALRLKSMAKEL